MINDALTKQRAPDVAGTISLYFIEDVYVVFISFDAIKARTRFIVQISIGLNDVGV